MISRNDAAAIRYAVIVGGRNRGEVAREYDVTVSAVDRIIEGSLVPVADNRVVIRPGYSPRSRVISAQDRNKIAHLLCYGATLQSLAESYGVAVRSIQHIREGYTLRVGRETRNSKQRPRKKGELSPNLVAEARYRHNVLAEPLASIAATLFVPYKNLHRAVRGVTFSSSSGWSLKDGVVIDWESPPGHALRLWLEGADEGFACDAADISRDSLRAMIANMAERRE